MKVTFFNGSASTSIVAAPQIMAAPVLPESVEIAAQDAATQAAAAIAPAAANAIRAQVAEDADRAVAAATTAAVDAAVAVAPAAADAVRAQVAIQADRAEAARDDASAVAGIREFRDLPTLLENATLTYGPGAAQVQAGDIIRTRAEGFAYRVVAKGSIDYDLATAGGVLLYLLPSSAGHYVFAAMAPAGDAATDDWPKLRRLLARRQSQGSATYPMGPTIHFDARKFFFNTDVHGIQLKALTHLIGQAQGINNFEPGTVFRFPAGVKGLTVNRHNTLNGTKEVVATGGADGSTVQEISFESTVSSDKDAHAIWLRSRAWIKNALIRNWGGNGIHVHATAGGANAEEGNANNWRVDSVRAQGCEHGIYVRGADANAGVAYSFDGSGCRRWGIFDQSFLGNTYIGCHTSTCGTSASEGQSSYCSYGGKYYHAVPAHVGGATETAYVATEPGTDPDVWRECNRPSGSVPWVAGLPDGTYRTGGGYCSTNPNARSSFISCYSEGGQGLTWLSQHSIAIGGFLLEVPVHSGANIEGRFGRTWSSGGYSTRITRYSDGSYIDAVLGGDANARSSFEWRHGLESNVWRLQYSSGLWMVRNANTAGRDVFYFAGENTTLTYGTASPKPWIFGATEIAIGSENNARRISSGSAEPSSREYGRGDVILNRNAIAGGRSGWICTTAGTAGSTAVFKPFGAIDA